MYKLLLLPIALFSTSILATPVYKCETPSGKVIYQNQECPNPDRMQEVEILTIDPEIVETAQKKLQQDVEAQATIDAEQAEQALKQRRLVAIEKNNTTGEAVTESTQEQTNYLQNKFNRDTTVKHKPVDY